MCETIKLFKKTVLILRDTNTVIMGQTKIRAWNTGLYFKYNSFERLNITRPLAKRIMITLSQQGNYVKTIPFIDRCQKEPDRIRKFYRDESESAVARCVQGEVVDIVIVSFTWITIHGYFSVESHAS